MARTVGLYLGINSVGVAVVQARNIIYLNNLTFSSLEESRSEVLNEDVRWEALINQTLREARVEGEGIYLSLADRDFIFRSLEMPLMRKTEIESSLAYEVEKYIPFKMSELEWSYENVRFPKEKKMNISFIGIQETNLARIREILARVGVEIKEFEPSSLSLSRALKSLRRLSKLKDFALLDLTEQESHLTFFQNELPVFNRYLTIPKKEEVFDSNKFLESVDFSFQYFKREFRSYKLDKFIMTTDIDSEQLASSLEEGLQLPVEVVSPFAITSRSNASLESIKAFGAASRRYYPSGFAPTFKKTMAVAEFEEAEVITEIPPLRIGLMGLLLGIGAIIAFFMTVFMGNEVALKQTELKKAKEAVVIPEGLKNFSWDEYKAITEKLEAKVKKLKNIEDSFYDFSGVFDILSRRRVLPEGLWLESLRINRQTRGYTGKISGYIFRDNDYQERLGLDEFIANLKKEEAFRKIFPAIEIDFSRRQRQKDFEVTYFSLNLK